MQCTSKVHWRWRLRKGTKQAPIISTALVARHTRVGRYTRRFLSTVVRKLFGVNDVTVSRWHVGPARKLLGLAQHTQLQLPALCAIYSQAFLLCPETATLSEPKRKVVPSLHPMIFIISSDWLAVLGVILVPPGLASTLPSPAGTVSGDAISVGVAVAAGLLGLRRRCAFPKPIPPTERTQGVVLCRCAYFQGEISPTFRLRLSSVAESVRETLPILLACLVFLLLSPTILHPKCILSSGRICLAPITVVRTVVVHLTCEVLIVRLQWLTCSAQTALETVDAVLVIYTRHAHLVSISTDPVGPLRRRLWLPPNS